MRFNLAIDGPAGAGKSTKLHQFIELRISSQF